MRDHQLFQQPNRVDLKTTVPVVIPDVWKDYVRTQEYPLIPLVKETAGGSFEKWQKKYKTGWIVYYANSSLLDSPEVEVFCSGLNVKTFPGAALWRQGNLFHFSFDVSPSELNEAGKALLLNSIVYISRFTEDRPIVRTPGGWRKGDIVPRSRDQVDRLFQKSSFNLSWLSYYFSAEALKLGNTNNLAGFKNWYQSARPYLHPGLDGRLTLDEEAKRWGTPFDTPEFFEHAFAELRKEGDAQATARRLLQRYAPEGPGPAATADAWQEWWRANRDYLFFCDSGGGYWYLDPLAKKRGLPSSQLRGPKRASLSP